MALCNTAIHFNLFYHERLYKVYAKDNGQLEVDVVMRMSKDRHQKYFSIDLKR